LKDLRLYLKKIGLFFLFFIVWVLFLMVSLDYGYNYYVNIAFFFVYFILAVLILIKFTKLKIIIFIAVSIIYLLIAFVQFNECHVWTGNEYSSKVQDCVCMGLEKEKWQFAGPVPTQCVGIIKNYKTACYEFVPREEQVLTIVYNNSIGYNKEVPCN